MEKRYVIWIDLKKAVIGCFDENNHYSHLSLASGIETRVRFPGETTNKLRLLTNKRNRETAEQRKQNQQLLAFCNSVIQEIRPCPSVLILGPADTKFLLQKSIEAKKVFENTKLTVKASDKITLAELKAAAMSFFKVPGPPRGRRAMT